MYETLRGLFDNCAMIHTQWGEDSNAKEAETYINRARAILAKIDAQ